MDQHVDADGEDIEIVNTFNFLGSLIVDEGGSSQEIRRRLAIARASAITLMDIWKDRGISRATKKNIPWKPWSFQLLHMDLKLGLLERQTDLESKLLKTGAGGRC